MSQFVGHDLYPNWGYVPVIDPTLAHFYEDPFWDYLYTTSKRPAGDNLYVTLSGVGDSVSSLLEPASAFRYADDTPFDPYGSADTLGAWLQMRTLDISTRFYQLTLTGPSGIYLGGFGGAAGSSLGWGDYPAATSYFFAQADYPTFLGDLAAGDVLLTVTLTLGGPIDVGFAGLGYHPATAPTVIPPLRQYPRDDGLATSSVTRSARASSRQASIRRGPRGTYY